MDLCPVWPAGGAEGHSHVLPGAPCDGRAGQRDMMEEGAHSSQLTAQIIPHESKVMFSNDNVCLLSSSRPTLKA